MNPIDSRKRRDDRRSSGSLAQRKRKRNNRINKSERSKEVKRNRKNSRRVSERGVKSYLQKRLGQAVSSKVKTRYEEQLEQQNNYKRQNRRDSNTIRDNLMTNYYKSMKEGPTHRCYSCNGRFFKHSVHQMEKKKIIELLNESPKLVKDLTSGKCVFCQTCLVQIKKGRIPRLCTNDGLQLPQINDKLKDLNQLEERMISPRLPFMQIRPLGVRDKQLGLKGHVVNVQIDVPETVNQLPRRFNDTETIQLKLKRMATNKTNYMFEFVRPKLVYEVALYLSSQSLFKKNKITIDTNWLIDYKNTKEDFIADTIDIGAFDTDETSISELKITEVNDKFSEINEETKINPGESETMIQNNGYIWNGQSKKIVSFYSEDCEYLAFPKIYGGKGFNEFNLKNLSIAELAKYKLRYFDRRFAEHLTCLFWLFRHKQIENLRKSINICLKKSGSTRKPITAGQVLETSVIEELIRRDDAFEILLSDRTSPVYWEKRMKDLMAMIRQLGVPTFFFTVSAAETQWAELLVILEEISTGRVINEDEALQMSSQRRYELINKDPVTCAQYFNYRFREFFKVLKHELGPFEPFKLIDWFVRVEFQHRGSPHCHCLLWLENAPSINSLNVDIKDIEFFIDKFITTFSTDTKINELSQNLQRHQHSNSCKRHRNNIPVCRFGIPFFPMRTTRVLEPFKPNVEDLELISEIAILKTIFKSIREKLKIIDDDIREDWVLNFSFDDFLSFLEINDEIYINAIRSNLKQRTVFLRRLPKDIRINGFNSAILGMFRSNMDLQYILDPYGCVHYIVNYISKSFRGISKLLRDAINDSDEGYTDPISRLRKIGNLFINGSEVSAQEAVYVILSMPLTMCSRKSIFINTGEKEKRTKILKSQSELKKLDPNSFDIMSKGLLDYYINRPKELDGICLAEFASKYDVISTKSVSDKDIEENIEQIEEIDTNTEFTNKKPILIFDPNEPNKVLRKLRERKSQKIIRYRRYQFVQDKYNYLREKIMLYIPWRDEERDILSKDICILYKKYENIIIELEKQFIKDSDIDYESIRNEIQDNQFETELNALEVENETTNNNFESSLNLDIPSFKKPVKKDDKFSTFKPINFSTTDEYNALIRSLNDLQRNYLIGILYNFRSGKTPIHHFITGGAGTGKSVLIKAIVQTMIREYAKSPISASPADMTVLVTAPTGMAARNINGSTIHSALGITTNENTNKDMRPLGDENRNQYRNMFSKLQLMIIDEVSMVGSGMLFKIDERLKQIMGCDLAFGGISLLFFGDFNQLPPVKEPHVFKPKNGRGLEILAGNFLWKDNVKLYRLTEIMRQKDDIRFAEALTRLVNFELTENDIELFNRRIFSENSTNPERTLESLPKNCVHLFAFNADVDQFNDSVIQNSPGKLIISHSSDELESKADEETKEFVLNKVSQLDVTDTQGLLKTLELKIGIRYMITSNIDQNDGLVNGTLGILKEIDVKADGVTPTLLWFDFSNEDIGKTQRTVFPVRNKWTPIETVVKRIYFNRVHRWQFPLRIAEAITIHKSQGQSYDEVVFHLSSKRRHRNLTITEYYTGLSRAKTARGLYLIGKFDPPLKPSPGNLCVIEEISRLESESYVEFDTSIVFPSNKTSLLFWNFPYLNHHIDDILCDSYVKKCDILMFVETRSNGNLLTDFQLRHQIKYDFSKPQSRPFGIAIYTKPGINTTLITSDVIFDRKSESHFELVVFRFKDIRIFCGYSSPNFHKSKTISIIEQFILKDYKTLLIGDFNIELNSKHGKKLESSLKRIGFTLRQNRDICSTERYSLIDLTFANFETDHSICYESLSTYHRPLFSFI